MTIDDPSSLKAYEDIAFLSRDELRPVRLMLELSKAELLQRDAGIRSTIVVFGSARLCERAVARERLEAARRDEAARPGDPGAELSVRVAERVLANSRYYDVAREF